MPSSNRTSGPTLRSKQFWKKHLPSVRRLFAFGRATGPSRVSAGHIFAFTAEDRQALFSGDLPRAGPFVMKLECAPSV